MNTNITHYYRHPGLTVSTVETILRKLQNEISPSIYAVDTELCYNLELLCGFSAEEKEIMRFMLSESYNQSGFSECSFLRKDSVNDVLVEVGPRASIVTAWCSNALSIFRSSNIRNVKRIEMSKRYLISSKEELNLSAVEALLHDEMTEMIYLEPLRSFSKTSFPEPVQIIPVLEEGEVAIERINRAWSLALSTNEVSQITSIFVDQLKRNPTDVEIMDFIQSNNEHCRNYLFNGKIIIDEEEKEFTMNELLHDTRHQFNVPTSMITFGKDGSAIKGTLSEALNAKVPNEPSAAVATYQNKNPVVTMTTHNFPSGVTPFPGAETGVGGQIREVISTGNGAKVMGGAAGFMVGNLRIPGLPQEWESRDTYPKLYSKPLNILLDASSGAADYANKFGEPIIAGTTRSFGQLLPEGSRSEYIKPVVMSNGFGICYDSIHNDDLVETDIVIAKIGGPAFRMGLKGGALSSKQQETHRRKKHHTTTSSSYSQQHSRTNSYEQPSPIPDGTEPNIDFEGVQRGDAEMGNKLCRVISTCVSMGQENPIINIFNQGAGGNSSIMKNIVSCRSNYKRGVKVSLDEIVLGDDSLSAREIWGAEYQENVCVLIKKDNVELLKRICERERICFMVIGTVTDTGSVEVYQNEEKVVDLPVEETYTSLPQHVYYDHKHEPYLVPLELPSSLTLRDSAYRVLQLLSVGSKRYFVNKFDRSISGLIASQPCCGPLYLPVADVAVIAKDYRSKTSGIAFAMGEQPIKSLLSVSKMVRLSIGEALTNLVFGNVMRYGDIHLILSLNCAGKLPGETSKLYECCEEIQHTVKQLGIEIVNYKDSVSLAVRLDDETVKAPLTLVVTGFANCEDVNTIITPDIKHSYINSKLILIDLASEGEYCLGGSALAQVYKQLGLSCPDVDLDSLQSTIRILISLIKQSHIIAGHDRSDGGLLTTVLEMCFAGNCGCVLTIPSSVKDLLPYFYNESLGVVVEVDPLLCEPLLRTFSDNHINASIIGYTQTERTIIINHGEKEVFNEPLLKLRNAWEATSYQLEKLTYNSSYVEQDYQARQTQGSPEWIVTYLPSPTRNAVLMSSNKYRVAIMREEGTNCDREMVAAFHKSGLEPWIISVNDLMQRKTDVSQFQGVVFCGGFSFGDVLDSARGWAACILFNDVICKQFQWFIRQEDRFSLGVCNGCQLMSQINYVPFPIPDRSKQPRFLQNRAGKLECRMVNVRIEKSKSVLLRGMEGSVLGVWVAHGEGRCYWPDEAVKQEAIDKGCVAMRYCDNKGNPTMEYPYNPNGSDNSIAGLCSENGHHLSLMPHPERLLTKWAWPYWPEDWEFQESPWLKLFQNARTWCEEIHKEK